jgi:hypothetical protein
MSRTRNGWHTPIYYKVRSVVRFAFWASLFSGTVLVGKWLVDTAYGDHRPACPIDIKHDFTWSRLDGTTAFTLTDCRPPQNVVLYNDGTWGWAN